MWFGIIGVMSLILSFLYLFRPEMIKKIDEFGKRFILTSEMLIEQKKIVGFFYLIAGIVLIYVAWRW